MSLFVAWMPDDVAQAGLLALRSEVEAALPAPQHFKWRPAHKLHMTLRFLGHVVDDLAPGLAQSLADIAARNDRIALRLDRAEVWPGAKALVARTAASSALETLLEEIDAAAIAAGYAAHSGHQTAHVTLAYAAAQPVATPAILFAEAFETPLGHVSIVETTPDGYRTRDWWPLPDGTSIGSNGRP